MVLSAVNLPLSDPCLLSAMLYLRQVSLTNQTPIAVVQPPLSRAAQQKMFQAKRNIVRALPTCRHNGSGVVKANPPPMAQHPTKVGYLWARGNDRIPPQQGGTCEPMGR